nr:hypothetical protein [Bacillus thuringiensis]
MNLSVFFIVEDQNEKFPREIFKECGFDIDIIGIHRIHSATKGWSATYKNEGVMRLRDTRTENSGKSGKKELTLEEKYATFRSRT